MPTTTPRHLLVRRLMDARPRSIEGRARAIALRAALRRARGLDRPHRRKGLARKWRILAGRRANETRRLRRLQASYAARLAHSTSTASGEGFAVGF